MFLMTSLFASFPPPSPQPECQSRARLVIPTVGGESCPVFRRGAFPQAPQNLCRSPASHTGAGRPAREMRCPDFEPFLPTLPGSSPVRSHEVPPPVRFGCFFPVTVFRPSTSAGFAFLLPPIFFFRRAKGLQVRLF